MQIYECSIIAGVVDVRDFPIVSLSHRANESQNILPKSASREKRRQLDEEIEKGKRRVNEEIEEEKKPLDDERRRQVVEGCSLKTGELQKRREKEVNDVLKDFDEGVQESREYHRRATLSREVWRVGGDGTETSRKKKQEWFSPLVRVEKHPSTDHEYLVSRGIWRWPRARNGREKTSHRLKRHGSCRAEAEWEWVGFLRRTVTPWMLRRSGEFRDALAVENSSTWAKVKLRIELGVGLYRGDVKNRRIVRKQEDWKQP